MIYEVSHATNQKTKFQEIDIERINVVEKDGKLKMVISNGERQHPGVVDGKSRAIVRALTLSNSSRNGHRADLRADLSRARSATERTA